MSFYPCLIDVADELIQEFGREVILRREKNTTPINPLKPWEGNQDSITDEPVYAVFLDTTTKNKKNSEVDMTRTEIYVASKNTELVIATDDKIIDSARTYNVCEIENIYPGPNSIAYVLQVAL